MQSGAMQGSNRSGTVHGQCIFRVEYMVRKSGARFFDLYGIVDCFYWDAIPMAVHEWHSLGGLWNRSKLIIEQLTMDARGLHPCRNMFELPDRAATQPQPTPPWQTQRPHGEIIYHVEYQVLLPWSEIFTSAGVCVSPTWDAIPAAVQLLQLDAGDCRRSKVCIEELELENGKYIPIDRI